MLFMDHRQTKFNRQRTREHDKIKLKIKKKKLPIE